MGVQCVWPVWSVCGRCCGCVKGRLQWRPSPVLVGRVRRGARVFVTVRGCLCECVRAGGEREHTRRERSKKNLCVCVCHCLFVCVKGCAEHSERKEVSGGAQCECLCPLHSCIFIQTFFSPSSATCLLVSVGVLHVTLFFHTKTHLSETEAVTWVSQTCETET